MDIKEYFSRKKKILDLRKRIFSKNDIDFFVQYYDENLSVEDRFSNDGYVFCGLYNNDRTSVLDLKTGKIYGLDDTKQNTNNKKGAKYSLLNISSLGDDEYDFKVKINVKQPFNITQTAYKLINDRKFNIFGMSYSSSYFKKDKFKYGELMQVNQGLDNCFYQGLYNTYTKIDEKERAKKKEITEKDRDF